MLWSINLVPCISYFQFIQSIFHVLRNCSKVTNSDGYHCYLRVHIFSTLWQGTGGIWPAFRFLSLSLFGLLEQQYQRDDRCFSSCKLKLGLTIINIIIAYLSDLLSVSYNLSPSLYSRPCLKEASDYIHYMYKCFLRFFLVRFSIILLVLSQGDEQFHNEQFFHFILAGTVRYLVNVFICSFLDHTQGSHYYCFYRSFKVLHFLNFYFQVFIFTCFISSVI